MISQVENSIHFLSSAAASEMIAADPYWPKWDHPWWHMQMLYEMGEAQKIPKNIIEELIGSIDRYPLKIFPVLPEDMPPDVDPFRGTPCHCQLGMVYQVLSAAGVNVDERLPWIRGWFLEYQMNDGGLNCDNDAYAVKDECPSSMVGTIAAFEAVLLFTARPFTPAEAQFIKKGAEFLMKRQLTHGSETKHNASERESAKEWGELCFPRFYFYDVLRGLNALTLWADKSGIKLPAESYRHVACYIDEKFPDGNLKPGRRPFAGWGTLRQSPEGEWLRKQPAQYPPLLEQLSSLEETSPFLSKQWAEVQARLQG